MQNGAKGHIGEIKVHRNKIVSVTTIEKKMSFSHLAISVRAVDL